MAVNDGSPDTVQGAFSLIKKISCTVKKARVPYTGVATTVRITEDGVCFAAGDLDDMGGEFDVTVTGSSPASFNSYFDRGLVIAVGSMTFKLAAKVNGSNIEFATYEEDGSDRVGATFGSLDATTGILRAEARMQRLDCPDSGSCGWNRHWRVYAEYTGGSANSPLKELSFAYSNISATPGQSGFGGALVTMSGDSTNGFKGRYWAGPATNAAAYYVHGNWTEDTNSKCYLGGVDNATTCGAGQAGFTSNANFVLNSAGQTAGTSQSDFFTTYAGKTWTSADPNVE